MNEQPTIQETMPKTLNPIQEKAATELQPELSRRQWLSKAAIASAVVAVSSMGMPSARAGTVAATLDLRDFGALGDNTTDDGPALQRAMDALDLAGGGILTVPPGRYVIKTPVYKDFLNKATAIIIRGSGSSSQFVIKAPPTASAITVGNLQTVLFDDLTFVGTPGVSNDAKIVLEMAYCLQAVIRHCLFYGLSSINYAGGSIVRANYADLRIEQCHFGGSMGGAYYGNPVVQVDNWYGVSITDTDFIDWGVLNGVTHAKTGLSSTFAWVKVGNTTVQNDAMQKVINIQRVRMDEGSMRGLSVAPDPTKSGRISHVNIEGLRINGYAPTGSVSIWLQFCDSVHIRQSYIGYNTVINTAINLVDAGNVRLDNVRCEQGMNRIIADAATKSLTLNDCIYTTLNSGAKVTTITKNGRQNSPVNFQNTSQPISGPNDGGLLYVVNGALMYRGSSGTVTTIAPA